MRSGIAAGMLAGAVVAASAAEPELTPVNREQFCITNGAITAGPDGHLAIDTPSSRAIVPGATAEVAEIRFRYLGPSATFKPLASGELRQQIGLKLKAQDTCNLIYVMWHIAPTPGLGVAIKRNPGEATHEQCGAHGYTTLKPSRAAGRLPALKAGEQHMLRAELSAGQLAVHADGALVWDGAVGAGASAFDGPVGLRTDNARFVFDYFAAAGTGAPPPVGTKCEPGAGD